MVGDSSKSTRESSVTLSGVQRAVSTVPGRLFFIITGVR
jgi:hypothetical protein